MTPAMLRIALLGSRSAWGRLTGIAAGVAVGTAMFLLLLGAYNGLDRRDDRGAALRTVHVDDVSAAEPLTQNNALVAPITDYFGNREIDHFEIAVTPNTTITIPGLSTIPGPGEYLASPALQRLIASQPADQLGDRYGTSVGTLPDSLLESPDSLVVLVGRSEADILARDSVGSVTDFSSAGGGAYLGYRIIVIIGAIGMFFPVLLFISIVTQLGAAQRQERFAALRLIGASPQTVSWFAGVETALTGSIGALIGVAVALAFRPVAAGTRINGERFFVDDFAVGTATILVATIGMVVVSTLAAGVKIRRTDVSPVNTVRDSREAPPALFRCLPLIAGFAMVIAATLLVRSYHAGGNDILLLFIGGFLLLLVGIVMIGPVLTYWLSGLLNRYSGSAATLIASRRISSTPSATFRSVSGLVVAVFVVTVFAGSASSVAGETKLEAKPGILPSDALAALLDGNDASAETAAISQIPGVEGTVIAYAARNTAEDGSRATIIRGADAALLGFTNIPDSTWVSFPLLDYVYDDGDTPATLSAATVADPAALKTQALIVRTDGSAAAIERARTALSRSPVSDNLLTRAEVAEMNSNQDIEELKVLAYLGAIISIAIAGCSLAIATACTMLDRKRVLGLMRLMGMPETNLRKIVAIEAAVPLLAVLGVVIGLGFAVAWCIIEGTSEYSIGWPDRWYVASIAFGLVLAIGMIAATFGLIRRNTLVTVTRFE
jgi:hypothetical protein